MLSCHEFFIASIRISEYLQVPQMQFGWEFKVNAMGRTWYEHAGMRQVQMWRPESREDEEEIFQQDEDPEDVALLEAAAAAAALMELVSSLQKRQADLLASVTAQQGKLETLTKTLKTKKGDALKTGQAQQESLDKEIKALQKQLAVTKAQIADAQKNLPATSKSVPKDTEAQKGQSSLGGNKAVASGTRSKPLSRASTMAPSKSTSSPNSKISASVKPVPVSRSSTIISLSSLSASGSSPSLQKTAAKTVPVPVAVTKEFGQVVEKLDSKLLSISDEICLDVDEQIWAPIKKMSFFPVMEKLPVNSAISLANPAENKKNASPSITNTPAKTATSTPVKSSATPLSRSSSSVGSNAIASPISSARK